MTPASSLKKAARPPKCPICQKPSETETTPFCSVRCQQVDLNRWLGEQYRIPSDEPGEATE